MKNFTLSDYTKIEIDHLRESNHTLRMEVAELDETIHALRKEIAEIELESLG